MTVSDPASAPSGQQAHIVYRVIFVVGVFAAVILVLALAHNIVGSYLLGIILAYLLLPVVRFIERKLPSFGHRVGTRHTVAVLGTFALFVISLLGVMTILLRPALEQTGDTLEKIPAYWHDLTTNYDTFDDWYVDTIPVDTREFIDEKMQQLGPGLIANAQEVANFVFNVGGGILTVFASFIIVPLFMVYFLIDQPGIPGRLRHQLPRSWSDDAVAIFRLCDRILGSYTRGIIIESTIVGIITGIGYWAVGIHLALPLAVIAFVGEIVPIIGPWIAFLITFPIVLVTQPDRVIFAVLVFGLIQMLEGWLLAPRIQGDATDYSSSTTLIILAFGGAIAGGLGVVLALPLTATAHVIVVYIASRLDGATPAEAAAPLMIKGGPKSAPAVVPDSP